MWAGAKSGYTRPALLGWSRFKYWYFNELEPDRRLFWTSYLVLLPLFLAPLFVTRFLPGLDLPFHLSMVDMLIKGGEAGSPYAPFYVGTPGVAPYAAHYLALWLLSSVMTLATAHKVVVVLYVAGMPAAAASLLGACGRSRIPALLGFPLAYNLTLHYGFVGFAISLPIVLWFLAELTKLLTADEWAWRRWVFTALLGVTAFLCHLQNFAYGMCAALAFIAFAGVGWRRRAGGLGALVPSLAALGWWQVSARFTADPLQQKKTFAYAWSALKAARSSDLLGGKRSLLDDLTTRIEHIPGHLLRGFMDHVDVAAARALLWVIAAYIALGVVGIWDYAERPLRPRMRIAGWIAFLGAVFAYLALPHHLPVLELMTFSPRFAVLAVLVGLLVVPASLKKIGGVARLFVLLPALAFCGIYGQQIVKHYRLYGQEIADFVTVLEKTPPGGKALGLVFDRTSRVMRIESALVGLPNLYPVVRRSPTSMVSLAYCGMRHIPCRRKEPLVPLPDPGPWDPRIARPEDAIFFFDYFFVRSPPPGYPVFGSLIDRVELTAQEGSWRAYRRKPGATRPPKPAVQAKPAAPAMPKAPPKVPAAPVAGAAPGGADIAAGKSTAKARKRPSPSGASKPGKR
jgi:hypothetical protein